MCRELRKDSFATSRGQIKQKSGCKRRFVIHSFSTRLFPTFPAGCSAFARSVSKPHAEGWLFERTSSAFEIALTGRDGGRGSRACMHANDPRAARRALLAH